MSGVCPCCGGPVDGLDLLTDAAQGLISRHGKVVQLPPARFRLLATLVARYPAIVSRADLIKGMANPATPGRVINPKTLDTQICHIRTACEDLGIVITSRWGIGYALSLGDRDEAVALRARRFDTDKRRRSPIGAGDHALVQMMAARGLSPVEIADKFLLKLSAVEHVLAAEPDLLAS